MTTLSTSTMPAPDGSSCPAEDLRQAPHEAVALGAQHAVQAAPSLRLRKRWRLQLHYNNY